MKATLVFSVFIVGTGAAYSWHRFQLLHVLLDQSLTSIRTLLRRLSTPGRTHMVLFPPIPQQPFPASLLRRKCLEQQRIRQWSQMSWVVWDT